MRGARRRATRDFSRHGEVPDLPVACPYAVEQILDPEWMPENVHGIKDPGP